MADLNSNFPCNKCGACCRNIRNSDLTQFLDRGDGICKYYNDALKLCSIYESRPNICRVELYYKEHLVNDMSWDSYVNINLEACKTLRDKDRSSVNLP